MYASERSNMLCMPWRCIVANPPRTVHTIVALPSSLVLRSPVTLLAQSVDSLPGVAITA